MMKTYPGTLRALPFVALAILGSGNAFAATTFNGGDLTLAGSWSNGLPSNGNNGTIATDGTAPAVNGTVSYAGGIINQTAGTLTSGNIDFTISSSSGNLTWNQSGGTLTATSNSGIRLFNVGTGVTYNISGGVLDFGEVGGARATLDTNGIFNMTGGLIQDGGLNPNNAGAQMNLSGGSIANFRRGFEITNATATVNVSGSFSITSVATDTLSSMSTANFVQGTGSLIFSNTWTGFFADGTDTGAWTATDWTNAFASDQVFVGATKVDGTNFNNFFQVAANGNLSMIPEPSVALLGAMGALGMLRRRRR